MKEKILLGFLYLGSAMLFTTLLVAAASFTDVEAERKLIVESFILGGSSVWASILIFIRGIEIFKIKNWKLL